MLLASTSIFSLSFSSDEPIAELEGDVIDVVPLTFELQLAPDVSSSRIGRSSLNDTIITALVKSRYF